MESADRHMMRMSSGDSGSSLPSTGSGLVSVQSALSHLMSNVRSSEPWYHRLARAHTLACCCGSCPPPFFFYPPLPLPLFCWVYAGAIGRVHTLTVAGILRPTAGRHVPWG